MTDSLPTDQIPEHDPGAHHLVGDPVSPEHDLDPADFMESDYDDVDVDLDPDLLEIGGAQ